MTAGQIIDACGGNQTVIELTGLTKGRISQWRSENHIPDAWMRFLIAKFPRRLKHLNGRARVAVLR